MIACWLAEDSQHMTPAQLASIRRSIRSISKLIVFSANQVSVLADFLGMPPESISVIPFGVDTQYYTRQPWTARPEARVVAVGGDSRRDYATLIAAARIANLPLTLVCYPRNIAAWTCHRTSGCCVTSGTRSTVGCSSRRTWW